MPALSLRQIALARRTLLHIALAWLCVSILSATILSGCSQRSSQPSLTPSRIEAEHTTPVAWHNLQRLPPVEDDFAPSRLQRAQYLQESNKSDNTAPTPAPATVPSTVQTPVPVTEPLPALREESAESSSNRVLVPLNPLALPSDANIQSSGELVSLSVREAPLHAVLTLLAQQQGLSLVASSNLKMPITVTLQPVPIDIALDAILNVAGCTWYRRGNVIYVSSLAKDSVGGPFVQGRLVKVFSLSYITASDVEKVVTGLLSPVGRAFIRQVDVKDRRRTQEQIVIEDLPDYLARAAQYIAEVDQPPRQVLIEARLLQVKLRDELLHGVNFESLARVAGANLDLNVKGMAFF